MVSSGKVGTKMKVIGFFAKVALVVFLTGLLLGLILGLRAAEALPGLFSVVVVGHV